MNVIRILFDNGTTYDIDITGAADSEIEAAMERLDSAITNGDTWMTFYVFEEAHRVRIDRALVVRT